MKYLFSHPVTSFSLLVLGVLLLSVGCSATRAGYESAAYEPSTTDGDFSVRNYDAMVLASTKMSSEDGGFMRLFRYIDGGNEDDQKIAMTTPVFTHSDQRMSFVLPKDKSDNPPAPGSDKVTIEEVLAFKAAVVRFSGKVNVEMVKEKTETLRKWMTQQNLVADSEPILAQYDPPWTPGPMRKNEVIIPIKAQ